ncbi:MAG TPA: GNAT family protein [Anaerolineaceae bacterium]|nr:GNAT family protein [Anaerolineaceae bacterium]HPN51142.1 GNAT family protein [Anaerolineaceae bacterium]
MHNLRPLFQGERTRLCAIDIEKDAPCFFRWRSDSEYWNLLSSSIAFPVNLRDIKKELQKWETDEQVYSFGIHTLDDDRLAGLVELEVDLLHRDAWVGIGIGEADCRGKGFGTDAMLEIMRFGFLELDLFRISLNTFEYNTPAIRTYEKMGFTHEGRMRAYLNWKGRRWDLIFMGMLRSEWESRYHAA